EIDTYFQP
ncbi:hypothetical protein MK534_07240, partial [Streptococcus gallolyticus subsp. gallolyticus]|nr:hypothetical protein [Streptococcus gallolyticus subsp. gallolyticus]